MIQLVVVSSVTEVTVLLRLDAAFWFWYGID
jgi:hypothetical protein